MKLDLRVFRFLLLASTAVPLSGAAGCSRHDDAPKDDADGGPSRGACGDVPASGRCADPSTAENCVLPTDGVRSFVARRTCSPSEVCRVDSGLATCEPKGDCVEGATSCGDEQTLRTCTSGRQVASPCTTRCKGNALGAACVPDIPLLSLKGRLANEVRKGKPSGDGLQDPTTEASKGMLVLSYHEGTVVDAQVTSSGDVDAGTFTIDVAAKPADSDFVGAVPVSLEVDRVLFGVADHGISQDIIDQSHLGALISQAPPTAKLWGWKWPVATLTPNVNLTIKVEEGAAAAHLYRVIFDVFETAKEIYPSDRPRSIIAWFRRGISYTNAGSRAAFFNVPNDPQGVKFDSQFIVGDDAGADVWADDIVVHEMGHHWMWSHSTDPGEGGPHFVFQKSLPGLAWSEGFANWLSLVVKHGPTFDFDVATPGLVDFGAGTGTAMVDGKNTNLVIDPTTPDKGIIQGMSEAQVAQILWRLGSGPGGPVPLLKALGAPRMKTKPFARGYTRREPQYDAGGTVTGYTNTGDSVPMLADFLDALSCAGFDHAAIDAAVEPTTRWPYPSASPLCQ